MAYTQEQIDSGEAYNIWWKNFAVYRQRKEKPRTLASARIGETSKTIAQTEPSTENTSSKKSINLRSTNNSNMGSVWASKRPRKQTTEGFTRGNHE
jgi:hypothetical protein